MNCDRCLDDGFYFDDGCNTNTCAHGGRTRSPQELKRLRKQEAKDASDETRKVVTIRERTERVMACPPRPCSCAAGDPIRAERLVKIRDQERRIAAKERA